jgi:hydrogenase maturation factor
VKNKDDSGTNINAINANNNLSGIKKNVSMKKINSLTKFGNQYVVILTG